MGIKVALGVESISPQLTGIGRYCWELATRLPAEPAIGSVTFVKHGSAVKSLEDLTRTPKRVGRLQRGVQRRLAKLLPRGRADVVHGPNYILPDWAGEGIVTVHDLSVFRFPETHPPERVADFERNFRGTIDRCRHLITDSEAVRQEVIAFAGLPPHRVTAIPLGVAATFRPQASQALSGELRAAGLRHKSYALTVSSLEPRKRIDRLLDAWRMLPPHVRDRYPLAIAGAAGWRNDALKQAIQRGRDEGWIIALGFVPEADLPSLYANAALFAFPSMYEGFGLPPLEAMASGVPTIVAPCPCLTEVTQGAAMVADPDDQPAFAQALLRGLEDEQWRQAAISAGIQVANSYSWERCISETVSVYQRVVAG